MKVCAKCEYCWEEASSEIREPCPECGSMAARRLTLHIEDKVQFRESIGGKTKDPNLPSRKKIRVEFFDGYEWSVALEKYVRKSKVIDKRQNHYHEKIEDPDTGKVIHECTEPLSEHRGHGYAKFINKDT